MQIRQPLSSLRTAWRGQEIGCPFAGEVWYSNDEIPLRTVRYKTLLCETSSVQHWKYQSMDLVVVAGYSRSRDQFSDIHQNDLDPTPWN